MKLITMGIIVVVISMAALVPVFAFERPESLEAIEFLTGYTEGTLSQKANYDNVPLIVDFNFDAKPLGEKIGFRPSGIFQFQIEPFISVTTGPDDNMEVGTSFFYKLGLLPEESKLQPYVKIGVGMVLMTQQTREQSTQFNFITSVAGGLHYFFQEDTAVTVEYRARHLSNASIDRPNAGIDTMGILAGIIRRF